MNTQTALKILTEEIHSAAVATIGDGGKPQIRIIDMMLYDEYGVYFLTAKGKEFYSQLMAQEYVAISAVKDKISISLCGYIKNIGTEKLDEIFEKNAYMQSIYPEGTRGALEVFCIYKAKGEYFDISEPGHVVRESFFLGDEKQLVKAYYVGNGCTGCGKCYFVCPQKSIDLSQKPVVIEQTRCLHCGNCAGVCTVNAIKIEENSYDSKRKQKIFDRLFIG